MQQYAGVHLLQNYSTCFGCQSHTSSEVHQTVTAASGTGHSVGTTTFRQRGQTVTAASGTGHSVGATTFRQHGHAGRRLLFRHYDLYQKLQLQFYVFLMVGAIDTRNM